MSAEKVETVEYTPRALIALPFGKASAIVKQAELAWHNQHSRCAALELYQAWEGCDRSAPSRSSWNLNAFDLFGERIRWQIQKPCEQCEGAGDLYALSGARACECGFCDGSGTDHLSIYFTTDADVTEILEDEHRAH